MGSEEDFYAENEEDVISVEEDNEMGSGGYTGESEEISNSDDDDTVQEEDVEPVTYSLVLDDTLDISLEDDDDSNDSSFSPEERLRYFSDQLMSCCVGDKGIKNYALGKLMELPSPRVFRDENYILFSVFYAYRGRLRRINIDSEFVKLFLNRNRGLLEKSKGFIDIGAYGEIDGSLEMGYIGGVLKHFKRLESIEELSEQDFETVYEKYLIEYKSLETAKVYSRAQTIITEGMQIGRKKLFGYEDSANYVKRSLADIEGTVDQNQGSGFATMSELLMEDKASKNSYKISDFDQLAALNEHLGGIYTGMFYQVIAPPKAGKSKLCARVVHTTAVRYGNNVTVWAQEGGKEAFLAQLRAIHFDYIYNTGVGITEKKFGINQDVILHDKFASDELRQLEASSKIDLASNQDYGSVDFIDRPFEVETFLMDIETSIRSNSSTMVVIDYLQLIESSTGMTERERTSKAYKTLLRFCKDNNIAVFSPGQYKQESIDRLIQSGSDFAEMRTAGGTTSEVIRTPDIIFALWASTQDLMNNSMKVLSVPSRFCKPFPAIDVAVDMDSCNFISLS